MHRVPYAFQGHFDGGGGGGSGGEIETFIEIVHRRPHCYQWSHALRNVNANGMMISIKASGERTTATNKKTKRKMVKEKQNVELF